MLPAGSYWQVRSVPPWPAQAAQPQPMDVLAFQTTYAMKMQGGGGQM